jgi:hypothetical protein
MACRRTPRKPQLSRGKGLISLYPRCDSVLQLLRNEFVAFAA